MDTSSTLDHVTEEHDVQLFDKLKAMVNHLEAREESLKEELAAEMEKTRSEADRRVSSLEESRRKYTKRAYNLKARVVSLEKDLAAERTKNSLLSKDCEELGTRIKDLEAIEASFKEELAMETRKTCTERQDKDHWIGVADVFVNDSMALLEKIDRMTPKANPALEEGQSTVNAGSGGEQLPSSDSATLDGDILDAEDRVASLAEERA